MPTPGGLCPWQVVVGGGVRRVIRLQFLLLVGAVAWPVSPASAADWATTSLSIPPGSYYIAWDSPANPTGGRRLLLSDNPENVSTTVGKGALWWDGAITAGQGLSTKSHRLFLWHVNKTSGPKQLAITLQNRSASNTIQVSSARKKTCGDIGSTSWLTKGKEIALAGLTGTLGAWTPSPSTVGRNSTETIWSATVPKDYLEGGLFEFTINRSEGTGGIDHVLRTVWCDTDEYPTAFPDVVDPIIPPTGHPHARGSWANSVVEVSNSGHPFTKPDCPVMGSVSFADWTSGTPPDAVPFTASQSWTGGEQACDNRGLFGVTETAKLWVRNAGGGGAISFNARVWARNTGKKYAGAAINKGVPPIEYGSTSAAATEVIWQADVGPGTASTTVAVMHAGGACLPVSIGLR